MTPADKTATCRVYVIGTPSGPFKIGVATNLKGRLSSIQTGCHLKVSDIYAAIVPKSHAHAVEARAMAQWIKEAVEIELAAQAKSNLR